MIRYLLLLLIPITTLAHDVVLRVDGRVVHTVNTERVEVTITQDRVQVDARTASSPTPPDPPPVEPPTTCTTPGRVQVQTINLTDPGSMQKTPISLSTGIKAFRFRTTADPNFAGQFGIAVTSTNPTLSTMWISECPGGPHLTQRFDVCRVTNSGSATLRWRQNDRVINECHLETGKTYYLNVKNAAKDNLDGSTCRFSNCPFYLRLYTR